MASLTIRNIEDEVKASLRLRAAKHGRSMEEEARRILRRSLVQERAATGLGSRIAGRFAAQGGVELPAVSRSLPRPSPGFDKEGR